MFRRVFRLALLTSAFVVGGVVGCGLLGQRVEGSGNAATEPREVGEVTEVTLSGIGDLVVVPGEKTRLVVTADDNIVPLLETTSRDGKLTLRVKSGFSVDPKTPITFTLFVPRLDKLTVSGAGNAAGEDLTGESLELRISGAGNVTMKGLEYHEVTASVSGAGNVTLAGTARKLNAKVSGAGNIEATELQTTTADVQISGAGDVKLWATGELKAKVSGAGDVRYKGSPSVEQRVSGSGSVQAID
jgi:hypothetical protein